MSEKWEKYLHDDLTKKEKEELFTVLDKDPVAKKELATLKNTIALTELLPQQEDQTIGERGWREWQKRRKQREQRKQLKAIVRFSATIAATILLTLLLNQQLFSSDGFTEIKVPRGQRVHLTLSDGSDVWLSSRSTLRFPNSFSGKNRKVTLNGEGFFNVKKGKPFIVETSKYNVTVLGTSFNLYAYDKSKKFEADLVTGKIQLSNPSNPKELLTLLPNQKASLTEKGLLRTNFQYKENKYHQNGIYNFEDQSLGDIFERLQQWYGIQFVVAKPEILKKNISGKFRQSDQIEAILAAIYRTDLFNYKIVSCKQVYIY